MPCRALHCAYQVGVDMFTHISTFPGGLWAICNIFKYLWYDIVLQRRAGKCDSDSEKYKRFIPSQQSSLCIFIIKWIIFLKLCSAGSLHTETNHIFPIASLIGVPGETNLIKLCCREESAVSEQFFCTINQKLESMILLCSLFVLLNSFDEFDVGKLREKVEKEKKARPLLL